jgi:excisionase family DNA binding protein
MLNSPPDIIQSGKYELREAAKALGVSTSTIDKWTRKGVLKCQIRKANGRRYWTGAELLRAWMANM